MYLWKNIYLTTEEEQSCNVERCQVRVTPSKPPRLRIREDVREQHCRTLRQALHVWMDQFPEDFDDPPNYTSLTHLEAFCRRVLPNSELDIKVHRKASQIRRPMEASPPHKLGYPTGTKPPPLVLKSANLVNGLNNNSLNYAKDKFNGEDLNSVLQTSSSPASQNSTKLSAVDSSDLQYADFLDIPETLFALQLTRMDCVRISRNYWRVTVSGTILESRDRFWNPFFLDCRNFLGESFPTSAWERSGPVGTNPGTETRLQWWPLSNSSMPSPIGSSLPSW